MLKYFLLFLLLFSSSISLADLLTPQKALNIAYEKNPDLARSKAQEKAERSAISSSYSLSNPRIRFSRERDMNFMQMEDGAMDTFSISQSFEFPTKYFQRGHLQETVSKRANQEVISTQLEVRSKTLSNYFRCYSLKKILNLLRAQKETLREIARIAEARRSAGAVPQQDEMKAHVEQTLIENEILLITQEFSEAKFNLNAVLNRPLESEVHFPEKELGSGEEVRLEADISKVDIQLSTYLQGDKFLIEEAKLQKNLAKSDYFPDFELMYARTLNYEVRGEAFGIQFTVPLWFWAKENSEFASAVSKEVAAKKGFEAKKNSIAAEVESLKVKVETLSRQLEIYKTALIPQATSSLNSSRSAYSTGKVGFQELLDAERTLYSVRIQYFENFYKYINAITELERTTGRSLSNLPFLVESEI